MKISLNNLNDPRSLTLYYKVNTYLKSEANAFLRRREESLS